MAKIMKKLPILALTFSLLSSWIVGRAQPPWWSDQGLLNPLAESSDLSPAVRGQLVTVAAAAAYRMDEVLQADGGAGADVWQVVLPFYDPFSGKVRHTTDQDLLVIQNIGQLKWMAAPFYDRLVAVGLDTSSMLTGQLGTSWSNSYPWTASTEDDSSLAILAIGQLKFVFALPELEDADGDGLADFREASLGLNVSNMDSDGDGIPDGWELTFGLAPLTADASVDADGDGLTNLGEYQAGSDPLAVDHPVVGLQLFTPLRN
tara:strand:- start:6301 stop:7083 length:783 start_codon:yes stop_codon:yes gene_type:complete